MQSFFRNPVRSAAALLFVVAAAVSEIVSVPLMHGGDKEDLTFFEIVTVAGILVLDPKEGAFAKPLTELRTPEWLASFALGALYADGEFAANG